MDVDRDLLERAATWLDGAAASARAMGCDHEADSCEAHAAMIRTRLSTPAAEVLPSDPARDAIRSIIAAGCPKCRRANVWVNGNYTAQCINCGHEWDGKPTPAAEVRVSNVDRLTDAVHAAAAECIDGGIDRGAAERIARAALRPVVEAFPADMSTPDASNDPPICRKCGEEYTFDSGGEPTPLCNDCAHDVVAAVWSTLDSLAGVGT